MVKDILDILWDTLKEFEYSYEPRKVIEPIAQKYPDQLYAALWGMASVRLHFSARLVKKLMEELDAHPHKD